MKIALVSEFFYPTTGGTQTAVAQIAEELAGRGHDITVFAPLTGRSGQPPLLSKAYQTIWVPFRPWPVIGYLLVQYRIWRRLPRDVDLIHVFHPAFGLAALMSRRHPTRLVVSLMGYDTSEFAAMPHLKQYVVLAVCRGADVVTAPSHDLALRAEATGLECPIEIIPHGVRPAPVPDPTRAESLRRALGLRERHTVFVTVQRLSPVKEPAVMLEAWQLLAREDCRLLILGGGDLESQLGQRRAEMDLSNVTIVGEVPHREVHAYLDLADAFIHHARYEAFGLSVLEAMSVGLPVIACAVGGVREIITDGVDGLLIPPSHPVAMAEATARLADSPELRGRLGRAARQTAARYAWPHLVARYEALYRGLL